MVFLLGGCWQQKPSNGMAILLRKLRSGGNWLGSVRRCAVALRAGGASPVNDEILRVSLAKRISTWTRRWEPKRELAMKVRAVARRRVRQFWRASEILETPESKFLGNSWAMKVWSGCRLRGGTRSGGSRVLEADPSDIFVGCR